MNRYRFQNIQSFYAVAIILISSPTLAMAADIIVAQNNGLAVEVKNVQIDYTQYSMFYTPEIEYRGIRAYQGDGKVTIPWSSISRITILGKPVGNYPQRLPSEIQFKDGRKMPLELVIESEKGLIGTSELGSFSIRLQNIKSIEILRAEK